MRTWSDNNPFRCWECGKEGAEYSYVDYNPTLMHDTDSATIRHREELKEKRKKAGDDMQHRMFCRECYEKRNRDLSAMRQEYGRIKKLLMLERAVRLLERQALDIYQYKDIIDDFKEYVEEHPEKFDSSHEMIAAIILVDNGIKAKIQSKVGSYRTDFLIPDMRIVLEVDGDLHKNNLFRDNERDKKIREILGSEWETARISTGYLEENAPALVDAMIAIRKEKKKLRAQHHGYLPDWYSSRNKAQRTRSIKGADEHLFDLD